VTRLKGGGRALLHRFDVPEPDFAHFDVAGSTLWKSYEFIGRMQADDPAATIGATIVSSQIERGGYVALVRRANSPSYTLETVGIPGTVTCAAGPDTGFVPDLGAWSVFWLRTVPEAAGLRVRAKVWDQRDPEPTGWAVDCLVAGASAKTGRVGLLAGGPGSKLFDDLGVWPVGGGGPVGNSETTLPLQQEDFESHVRGQRPDDWVDAIGSNPVTSGDPLVWVETAPGGGQALTMQSIGSDMSSHFDADGSDQWSDYEVTGRMTAEHPRSKFGLLIYSQRHAGGAAIGLLRDRNSDTFQVTLVGASSGACTGTTDTQVGPVIYEWQRFRLRATGQGASVRVRARVWSDGEAEPTDWQADCLTTPGAVSDYGTFGVWSSGTSAKYWDDFVVRVVGGN